MIDIKIQSKGEKTSVEAKICGSLNEIINESFAFVRSIYEGLSEANPGAASEYKKAIKQAVASDDVFTEGEIKQKGSGSDSEDETPSLDGMLKAIREAMGKGGGRVQ